MRLYLHIGVQPELVFRQPLPKSDRIISSPGASLGCPVFCSFSFSISQAARLSETTARSQQLPIAARTEARSHDAGWIRGIEIAESAAPRWTVLMYLRPSARTPLRFAMHREAAWGSVFRRVKVLTPRSGGRWGIVEMRHLGGTPRPSIVGVRCGRGHPLGFVHFHSYLGAYTVRPPSCSS